MIRVMFCAEHKALIKSKAYTMFPISLCKGFRWGVTELTIPWTEYFVYWEKLKRNTRSLFPTFSTYSLSIHSIICFVNSENLF